jgi:hypothetical protein
MVSPLLKPFEKRNEGRGEGGKEAFRGKPEPLELLRTFLLRFDIQYLPPSTQTPLSYHCRVI